MSIIKRKAGCEDIAKSVLEFDEVPTEGSPNLVESGAVAQALAEGGKLAVFECRDNGADQNFFTGPTYAELEAARTAGKAIALLVHYGMDTVVDRCFEMTYYGFGRGGFTYKFTEANEGRVLQFSGKESDVEHHAWSSSSAQGITKFGDKTESDLVDNTLTIGGGNSLTKLTLTTVQTLTVLANVDVPNFALEIDNTGNHNDVTVTVKDFIGTTALNASAAGGNTVGAGKYVQLTCVGNCWTLAEFAVPTP